MAKVALSQNDIVLEHLERFGVLTSLTAMNKYGIMRLASRVTDLRNMGYDIKRNWGYSKDKDGKVLKKYAVYYI